MKPAEIVEHAYRIAREYADEGMLLTLRQLYYQFVARGLLDNGQKSYRAIGAALTTARLDGRFPIEWIEDRGRSMTQTIDWSLLDVARSMKIAGREIAAMPERLIFAGRWLRQPNRVSVFVEKEALAGVLEPICTELEVALFPCKGYPSISAIKSWVDSTAKFLDDTHDEGKAQAVIVYLGDHDPDGLQIPESLEGQIRAVQRVTRQRFPFMVDRVALTVEQIEEHDPPPFPAKETSSRFASYVERTGLDEAWELDALDPRTLRELVETSVDEYFDEAIHAHWQARAEEKRLEFVDALVEGSLIRDVLRR